MSDSISLRTGIMLFLALVLTTSLASLVPVHSDDYRDSLKPVNFQTVAEKYCEHSGRLVADILSPLLSSAPQAVKALSTGLVFTLLIYSISTVIPSPCPALTRRYMPGIFGFIFLSYWLLHPALGEATFWITGAANYLWPTLFAVMFVKYCIRYGELHQGRDFLAAAGLAFFAGCSNEAATMGVMSFTGLLLCMHFGNKRVRTHLAVLFLICLAGSCVLLFAPGNMVRMAENTWLDLSWPQKIFEHFINRVPTLLRILSPILGIIALLGWWLGRKKQWNRYTCYAALFLISAFLTGIGFVASPWVSRRAMSSQFVFLLCATACLAWAWLSAADHKGRRFGVAALWIMATYFVLQYGLMFNAYCAFSRQNALRGEIVQSHLARGDNTAHIPGYFYPVLLSGRHRLDRWDEAHWLSLYYGIPHVQLLGSPGFDYSLLMAAADRFARVLAENHGDGGMVEVLLHHQTPLLSKRPRIVIGLPASTVSPADKVTLSIADTRSGHRPHMLENGILIRDHVFFGTDIPAEYSAGTLHLRSPNLTLEFTVPHGTLP